MVKTVVVGGARICPKTTTMSSRAAGALHTMGLYERRCRGGAAPDEDKNKL